MNGRTPTFFTRVILLRDVDAAKLIGNTVDLEIDQSFKIGHSIAVLFQGTVVGHLERQAARVVWRHLRSKFASPMTAEIYHQFGTLKNDRWFSAMTHSFEIGVRITFHGTSVEDARLLLAHASRRKLHSFSGVEVDKCPEDLAFWVRPFQDENGISSLYFV